MNRVFNALLIKTPLSKNPSVVNILSRSASVITYGSLVMCGLSSSGLDISPLLTSLGVTSAIGAFASRDILSNMISGVYMTVNVAFHDNDYIKIVNGSSIYQGRVTDWTTKHLTLRQIDGTDILLPNKMLTSSVIIVDKNRDKILIPCYRLNKFNEPE